MKTRKPLASSLTRFARLGLMAGAVAAILGGSAIAPAFADEWRHGRDVREHDWRDHERFDRREHFYVSPRFGYAPGYYDRYAPAPFYAVPSFHFSIR
jgi:hypothetical protein